MTGDHFLDGLTAPSSRGMLGISGGMRKLYKDSLDGKAK